MNLYLDLSLNDKIYLSLFNKDFFSEKIMEDASHRELLDYVDEFLKANNFLVQDLQGIIISGGAGSFTSSRIMAVFANTAAFALKIPVIKIAGEFQKNKIEEYLDLLEEKEPGLYLTPEYSGLPNIGGIYQLKINIFGFVQGVFFRKFIKEKADAAGLVGWVKNLSNGSVETLIQGGVNKLQEIEKACQRGPTGAIVEKINTDYQRISKEEYTDFQIL